MKIVDNNDSIGDHGRSKGQVHDTVAYLHSLRPQMKKGA